MRKSEVEIEMAIKYLQLARDHCRSLQDIEEIPFTGNFFKYFSMLHKEMDEHRQSITEESKELESAE